MILTTIGLLLSTVAAPDVKAVAGWDAHGRPVLTVTTHGRTRVIPEYVQPDFSKSQDHVLSRTVAFHGMEFKGMDGRVVNAKTGASAPLKPSAAECQGGMALKRLMIWFYATFQESDYGTSKPVTAAYVYVVGERAGVPVLDKAIDVLKASEGSYYVLTRRCGDCLMIRGTSGESYGLLNLDSLKFMVMPTGVEAERPVRPTQDAAISDSGRVYWQQGETLNALDWSLPGWKPVRAVGTREGGGWISEARGGTWGKVRLPHDWVVAVGVGSDDLLVSPDLITFAHRDCSFRVPPSESGGALSCHIFLDRPRGIGVAWLKKNGQVQGSFLHLQDLEVLCPITGRQ